MEDGRKLKITLVHSIIGRKPKQRRTAQALGLGKVGSTVIKESRPSINGMVRSISHLVSVEELE
jgi:large subunit ribosomal protein L30